MVRGKTGAAALFGVCALLLGLVASGCQSKAEPSSTAGKSTAAEDAQQQAVTEIEDQLRSAIYQLQPENLNIDARLDDATSVLNNWWAAVRAADMVPTGLEAAEIPRDRVPAEVLPRIEREAFDTSDGRYIRNCYLAQRISDRLSEGKATDLERVVAVFDWVCRNVVLKSRSEPEYPTTVYETLLIGRGRPEDRAAAVAALLKAMRLDSVVLRPQGTDKSSAAWMLGVIVDGQVYLFDPRLGLPIPRGDSDHESRFSQPATLAQLREHPEWLEQLSGRDNKPYPLSREHLDALHADAVTALEGWSSRIWALEQLLPAETLCVLYDPPTKVGQLPGVFDRIAAALPGLSSDDIGVWSDPIQQDARMMAADEATRRNFMEALVPFTVPIDFQRDDKTQQIRRTETMRQLRIRTDQLAGRRSDAIAQYVTIRQLSVTRPPEPALGVIYQRAADDALYWSCVCKAELGEYDSAVKLLQDYLKRYRRSGQWGYAARLLLANCHAELGQYDDARQLLKVVESDDPYSDLYPILDRHWTRDAAQ